jgi:hypothetical protein
MAWEVFNPELARKLRFLPRVRRRGVAVFVLFQVVFAVGVRGFYEFMVQNAAMENGPAPDAGDESAAESQI